MKGHNKLLLIIIIIIIFLGIIYFVMGSKDCYQEDPMSASDCNNFVCEQPYREWNEDPLCGWKTYKDNGNDGNWETRTTSHYIVELEYMKPENARSATGKIKYNLFEEDGSEFGKFYAPSISEYDIPKDCFNAYDDKLVLRVSTLSADDFNYQDGDLTWGYYCDDGITWVAIETFDKQTHLWEEAIVWKIGVI